MKVGILTFPNSTSYGATLQMYALYKKVNDLGHDAEIINYFNAYMKAEKHIRQEKGRRNLRRALKHSAKKALHFRQEKAFRRFEKNNMELYPKRAVVDKSRLPEIGKRYGAVICGSDQVWNPNITDSDISYFLDFCGEGTRRISYAPSFGIDDFPREFSDMIRPEIAAFDSLSVREEAGREYIKNEFGRDARIVCDPTMLLPADEWEKMERPYSAEKNGYILYYTVGRSESLMRYCKELSKKTGLKIIHVGGNIIKAMKNKGPNFEYAVDISPCEWLWLVHHARYVVTNSFHGCSFSVIFRKSFYLEYPWRAHSRIDQIVSMLGSANPVIKEGVCEARDLDYSDVEEGLSRIRSESLDYLKKALGDSINNG